MEGRKVKKRIKKKQRIDQDADVEKYTMSNFAADNRIYRW
jgi:hypothetical protein